MKTILRPALVIFLMLTLLTGAVYPLVVSGVAIWLFPHQANGSLIEHEGKTVGSELIGQLFTDARYFWSRPSATAVPYDASGGSGSNLAPTNLQLADSVRLRIATLKAADPGNIDPVPVDLVTASGSGLDPHISLAAARYQIKRVARARHLPEQVVGKLVDQYTESRTLGVWGEPRVKVLALNLALDHRECAASSAVKPSGGLAR